jgi:hypothetical protein
LIASPEQSSDKPRTWLGALNHSSIDLLDCTLGDPSLFLAQVWKK